MLVTQMLLPRFLVLEGLLFFHLLHKSRACFSRSSSSSSERNVDEPDSSAVAIQDPYIRKCGVDLNRNQLSNLPLFSSSDTGLFVLPIPMKNSNHDRSDQKERWINFGDNSVQVSCPGAKVKSLGQGSTTVRCLRDGSQFETTDGRILSFHDLSCSRSVREKVQKTTQPCGPSTSSGKIAQIGWKLGPQQFVAQLEVCHDAGKEETFYVHHTLYGLNVEARNTKAQRPSYFKEGGFFKTTSASNAYKVRNQKTTFTALLGSRRGQAVFDARRSFLAKGHLAPDADFVYKEWQDATYYFLNVIPQWQAFNNGNWKAIETAVREYAVNSKANLDVYTGGLGILKYKNARNQITSLYIAKDRHDNYNLIPVPEFVWKVVYNPNLNAAIVFIGLNDPHFQGNPETEAQICPDICANEKWFFLYQKNVSKGFSYCCSYQDFKGVIDWVPDLGDPEILENILSLD